LPVHLLISEFLHCTCRERCSGARSRWSWRSRRPGGAVPGAWSCWACWRAVFSLWLS